MNILFHFVSLPHLDNETSLYTSLIHEFKKHGHNVLVSSRSNDDSQESKCVIENGLQVLRVKSRPFTGVANPIKKAKNQVFFGIFFWLVHIIRYRI